MLTILLNTLADIYSEQWETESNSTEDMLASMEQLNRVIMEQGLEDVIIISTDVKALYPNLMAKISANIVNKMLMNSDLILVGMDWEEAALYLVLTLSQEEIAQLGMDEIMPKRRKAGGTHPGITTAEVRRPLQTENSKSLFKKGSRNPTEIEKRKILAKCIEVAIVTCMSNHMYTFNKETFKLWQGL